MENAINQNMETGLSSTLRIKPRRNSYGPSAQGVSHGATI